MLNYNANLTNIFNVLCKINKMHFLRTHCSHPCVGPFLTIKVSFFLLSIFVYELISTPKILTFLPNPVPENEKLPCLSNPIPNPKYLYLSMPTFLVKVTAPNKQFYWLSRILAEVNASTYLINNVNFYYFPMIKCNQAASIKFYFCFSTLSMK